MDTLASGEQFRSVGSLPARIGDAARALAGTAAEEAAYIPDYVTDFPVEYWRSLQEGRQADSIAGLIRGGTDQVSLGLLRVDAEPRFGNRGTFEDGQNIGRSTANAELGAAVAAGTGRLLPCLRSADASASSVRLSGVPSDGATTALREINPPRLGRAQAAVQSRRRNVSRGSSKLNFTCGHRRRARSGSPGLRSFP